MSPKAEEIELGEYRLSYSTLGSGPPLLLLHGSDKREDNTVWSPLLELSNGHTMILPDLVGFGRSSRPSETPDFRAQARILHEFVERISLQSVSVVGRSWGGQVALEFATNWPRLVESLVLISSTYDTTQIPSLRELKIPTLIAWAEDDMIAQLKAGYLLRDAIVNSRLEVLPSVAKDPSRDFTIAHKLERFAPNSLLPIIERFLASPSQMVVAAPDMESELRGMAMQKSDEEEKERAKEDEEAS